jgi:MSHA biogenesis protein MshM
VIIGNPGVGKSVLKDHIIALDHEPNITVVSCLRTMHTYVNILKQLAESFKLDVPTKDLEKTLFNTAFAHIRDRKTLYTLIDEAHLLSI